MADTPDTASFDDALALHQQQRFGEAEAAYRAILADAPHNGAVLLNLGQVLRRLGKDAEAEALYRQATELPESAAGAWYNLGNLAAAGQDYPKAADAFRKAISLQPEMAPAHYQLGCVLRDIGEGSNALASFGSAIEHDSQLTSAHMNIGNLLRSMGDLSAAARAHQIAFTQAPDSWEVRYNLARALEEAGDPEASDHLEYALDHTPQPATIHHGFAEAAGARGAFERAVEHYRAALALEPDRRRAQMGLGRSLMRLGHRNDALREFTDLSGKIDVDIHLLSELATVEWSLKLREEPIALLRRIVQLAPRHPDALVNLARALSSVWEISEFIEICERALAVAPDHQGAQFLKAYALVECGRVDEGVAAFKAAGASSTTPNASLLFSSLYSDTMSVDDVFSLHRDEGTKWGYTPTAGDSHSNTAEPERQLRIGYLSPDFKGNHPVSIFLKPVLKHHNRENFEIFAYSGPDYVDETTAEIEQLSDRWRDITNWSNERLAASIRDDGIDILIDLSGLTARARIAALRAHPAPIQACYIGYPHSTGLQFIDYLICDETIAPTGQEHLLTETPMRLTDCVFCFAPEDPDWPPIEPDIAAARDHVVFGSFNHVPKLTATTVSLWARILQAVPNSRLKLKAAPFGDRAVCERYQKLFAARNVDPDRIQFDGPSEFPDLMAAYRHIDIGLDPYPYNGGTTTYQALWMGVPVISLSGHNFCSRMGHSILGNLGLDDLIAQNEDDYIQAAVDLAADAARRASLRTGIREKIRTSRSCDPVAFTANLEDRFRQAWRKWCASQPTC